MSKISLQRITKVFAPEHGERRAIKSALAMADSGASKSDILNATGCTLALRDISLAINQAERCAVMGVSGSGKSTLARLINRLIEPTRGHMLIDSADVMAMTRDDLRHLRRHTISMVFQSFALFPHKSVRANIAYGLTIQGKDKNLIAEQTEKWIHAVGLKGYESASPQELSGGMRQRVGLARALAISPQILLMDEPFSALDPLTRTEMQNLLLTLAGELSITIVFITHDFNEALKIGQRIAILKEGSLISEGTPREIVSNPHNDDVRAFIKDARWPDHMQAQDLMEPIPAGVMDTENTLHVRGSESLNEILKRLSADIPNIMVINESAQPIGIITPQILKIAPE